MILEFSVREVSRSVGRMLPFVSYCCTEFVIFLGYVLYFCHIILTFDTYSRQ